MAHGDEIKEVSGNLRCAAHAVSGIGAGDGLVEILVADLPDPIRLRI
jgi:hypothetical protein